MVGHPPRPAPPPPRGVMEGRVGGCGWALVRAVRYRARWGGGRLCGEGDGVRPGGGLVGRQAHVGRLVGAVPVLATEAGAPRRVRQRPLPPPRSAPGRRAQSRHRRARSNPPTRSLARRGGPSCRDVGSLTVGARRAAGRVDARRGRRPCPSLGRGCRSLGARRKARRAPESVRGGVGLALRGGAESAPVLDALVSVEGTARRSRPLPSNSPSHALRPLHPKHPPPAAPGQVLSPATTLLFFAREIPCGRPRGPLRRKQACPVSSSHTREPAPAPAAPPPAPPPPLPRSPTPPHVQPSLYPARSALTPPKPCPPTPPPPLPHKTPHPHRGIFLLTKGGKGEVDRVVAWLPAIANGDVQARGGRRLLVGPQSRRGPGGVRRGCALGGARDLL